MKYDLISVLIMLLTTFIFTALIIPIVKKIAFHVGAVDQPNERRVNKIPMPNLGGLGIFAGFLLGYMLFCEQTALMNSVLIGGFILIITGMIDGVKDVKARYQLLAHIASACIVVFYGGLLINNIDAFGLNFNFGIFAYPITIFFIVGMINVINIIDGLDGLAAGISSIYFLTIGIIAFIMKALGGLDIALSFIMLGSTLGFLLHNFYPAKIYMGNGGSMFLGFIISIIALLGFKNVTLTSLIVPVLIMAVPILDTLFAIIRRLLNKQSIAHADKQHLHHQLLKMNFSHRMTVLIIYYIDILFAIASIVYILKDAKLGIIIYLVLLAIVFWFVITTNIVVNQKKTRFSKENK